MIRPFRLTRRGSGMLLGGAAATVAGLLAGATAITAAGLFALIVVALCVGWVLVRRSGASVERSDVPLTLRPGERFTTAAIIRARSFDRGNALLDGVVPAWATEDSMDTGVVGLGSAQTRLSRHCSAHRRGLHTWPAIRLELPDPLGVAHGIVELPSGGQTIVFPKLEPLGPAKIAAITGGVSELDDATVLARVGVGDPGANPIPRPFQPGDGLRRIHWPATARAGEPMVRAEDGRPVRRAVVLLDCDRNGYRTDDGFERAVSATASIAVRLLQLGWAVSVRLAGGAVPGPAVWAEGRRGEFDVLTALATVSLGAAGQPVRPQPQDPEDAAYALTGGGAEPHWCMPALLTIRTEAPAGHSEHDSVAIWDGSEPLGGVWTSGANRLVAS